MFAKHWCRNNHYYMHLKFPDAWGLHILQTHAEACPPHQLPVWTISHQGSERSIPEGGARVEITVTDDTVRSPMIPGLMNHVSEGPRWRHTNTDLCLTPHVYNPHHRNSTRFLFIAAGLNSCKLSGYKNKSCGNLGKSRLNCQGHLGTEQLHYIRKSRVTCCYTGRECGVEQQRAKQIYILQ